MPKLWYPNPDQLERVSLVNETVWFQACQPVLLAMLQSQEGRDILRIDKAFKGLTIDRITKNEIRAQLEPGRWVSDFRIGAKWGNVIRYRWKEFVAFYEKISAREYLKWLRSLPPLIVDGKVIQPIAGGDTLTAYPDPDPETTTFDGQVRRNTVDETWATIHDGDGNGAFDADATLGLGWINSAATTDLYDVIRAGYALFDTSSIPDGNTIESGTLELVGNASLTGLGDLLMNITEATTASNTGATIADYENSRTHTTHLATGIAISTVDVGGSTYTAWTLNTDGEAHINKTGVTKFRIAIENFIDNSEPTWITDTESYINADSAEVSGTTEDPKLVVVHSSVVAVLTGGGMAAPMVLPILIPIPVLTWPWMELWLAWQVTLERRRHTRLSRQANRFMRIIRIFLRSLARRLLRRG